MTAIYECLWTALDDKTTLRLSHWIPWQL
jgi:hypothetical protein